jgi:peptide/nickel transport system permease protein
MLQVAQTTGYLLVGWKYWYLMFPAGLSITLLSSAFYLVGRALDEVINPRLRRR